MAKMDGAQEAQHKHSLVEDMDVHAWLQVATYVAASMLMRYADGFHSMGIS
jgi:hypothetical protein